MTGKVQFLGPGPFSVGPAQSASAKSVSGIVQGTINVVVGDDPHPRPIAIQMTHGVANRLGHQLIGAALEIEAQEI